MRADKDAAGKAIDMIAAHVNKCKEDGSDVVDFPQKLFSCCM